jgi:beta-xylosidase
MPGLFGEQPSTSVDSSAMKSSGNASRRHFLGGLAAASMVPLAHPAAILAQDPAQDSVHTYKNPLPVLIGDPYVLRVPGDGYYIYGTGGGSGADLATGFPTFRSSNLVEWTQVGQTYRRNPVDSWCIGDFWAPEVYHVQGRYYMFYSAQWRTNPTNEKENFRIGVAVADSPSGPFRDVRNRPIFDPGYPIIDADVLFDTDGRTYLYYSRCCYKHPVESELADWARKEGWYTEIEESWIYCVELKPDFSGVLGEPVLVLRPPVSFADWHAGWENRSALSHAVNRRWTEGPTSFRHNGKYYLMYSANSVFGPEYALGYAVADHPLGPFEKSHKNPVVQKNTDTGGDVTTTAHNCVTTSPDGSEMYCLYGAHAGQHQGFHRIMFLSRMHILDSGILLVDSPDTTVKHPYPSGSKII